MRPLLPTLSAGSIWTSMALVTLLAACGSASMRAGVSVGPQLTTARLGSVRSSMTYDGDWLGGMPSLEYLEADLDLACRRGVETVIDLRSGHAQEVQPISKLVADAGLAYVPIRSSMPEGDEVLPARFGVSDAAVDHVRRVLNAPGRRRSLLLDESGTRSSMVYAIHLVLDERVAEAEALRAARATGLSQEGVDFVRDQVARLRDR